MRLLAEPRDIGRVVRLRSGVFFVQNFLGEIQDRRQPIFALKLPFAARQHALRQRAQVHEGANMVQQSLSRRAWKNRLTQAIETSLLQRPERGYQVAAVDRRNEKRRFRFEGAGVIPVQKMATILAKADYRSQCLLCEFHHFWNCEIAELIGNLPRVQKKPYVRRGYAGRHLSRFVLNVIGHEPVVFLVGKLRKVPPDMQSGLAQKAEIPSLKFWRRFERRGVEPSDEELAAGPQPENWGRSQQ